MVTTNDETLWKKMWAYKDHGKSWDAIYNKEHPPGFRWLHESFGTNWRITEMQSAIGRIQLKRMGTWFEKRNNNSKAIGSTLAKYNCIRIVEVPDYIEHAQYKYYAFVKPELLNEKWTRDRIVNEVNALGVPCFQGSCSEVYLEKAFDNTTFRPKQSLPIAKELGATSLMFLVHPTLTGDEIAKTCSVLDNIIKQAGQ